VDHVREFRHMLDHGSVGFDDVSALVARHINRAVLTAVLLLRLFERR
jgi:hypothetical protein